MCKSFKHSPASLNTEDRISVRYPIMLLSDRPRLLQGVCDTLAKCTLTQKMLIHKDKKDVANVKRTRNADSATTGYSFLTVNEKSHTSLFRNTSWRVLSLDSSANSWALRERCFVFSDGTVKGCLMRSCFSIFQSVGKYFSNWVTKVVRWLRITFLMTAKPNSLSSLKSFVSGNQCFL
jgi:hypothetical protein